jgi:hypothetical protein
VSFIRSRAIIVLLAALAGACAEHGTAPARPTSVQLLSGNAQSGVVGAALSTAPTFVVNDEQGHPMSGVPVTVAIVSGGGSLASAPTRTTSGPTSIGAWTLGPKVGENQVTVTVQGLTPLTITATGTVGAPAKLVTSSPLTIAGRAAEMASPIAMHVSDAFDNPVSGATVALALSGSGSVSHTLTTDASGNLTVTDWSLGTVAGPSTLTASVGGATLSFVATIAPGDPAQLVKVSGDQQTANAGTVLGSPVVLRLDDRYGNGVGGQSVSLAVTTGGGVVNGGSSATVVSGPDGSVSVSSWSLGRSAVPQGLHAAFGTLSTDVTASVKSDYHIEVRFFGPAMTDDQRALFTTAAARISGVITGDVPDVPVAVDVAAACGVAGLPSINETVDDLVIYASVQNIDGPRGILAESGPCVFRAASAGHLTAVGVMAFDSADLASMGSSGILQDVITHEMLHVVGVGTLWDVRSLLTGAATAASTFVGSSARQGCSGTGGTSVCALGVPVENNGVPGTADAHWREATFQSELMTGYVNSGGMPFSQITVGSLADLGYVVNPFAADPYQVPIVGGGASTNATTGNPGWEAKLPGKGVVLTPTGATFIRK